LLVLRRFVLRRRRRFLTTFDAPFASTFTALMVFGRRRRGVFRFAGFLRRFVVRRFLRFTPALPAAFDALRFLVCDELVAASRLTVGDEDWAATSASSCNHPNQSSVHLTTWIF